jgi:hypothetical protein
MSPVLQTVFTACIIAGALAWLFALRPFMAIAAELRRARKAGEADHIPIGSGRLPAVVIFNDALPNVREDRRKPVRAFGFFVVFWFTGVVVAMLFGPHR